MSNSNYKSVIIMGSTKDEIKMGQIVHFEPQPCYLISLASGETIYYPISQCLIAPRAQALEIAIASGQYKDLTIKDLAANLLIYNINELIDKLREQDSDS